MNLPISVVIPTFKRPEKLCNTIHKIQGCIPAPSEIIVHIDGGDNETEPILRVNFSNIRIIKSSDSVGPGGGRSRCIEIAGNEYIATFDDDSFPIQLDYFARLFKIFESIPCAALIESTIFHQNEEKPVESFNFWSCYLFTGCGVAYRKSWFLKIGGYLPVTTAYGIEEVDFSIRAINLGALFIRTSWLTVFHDTQLIHHASAKINAAAITNQAVLVFLRYPVIMWGYGMLQVLNRLVWSLRNNRFKGILSGLLNIPVKCLQFSSYRYPLKAKMIKKFLKQRSTLSPYEPAT